MKRIIKKSILTVCLVTIMCVFAGCADVKKQEDKLGVSYSNIVCEYSAHPSWGLESEVFPIHTTVYADNTVEVWTGPFYYDGEVIEVIYSETVEITEEQKQELIDSIKENKIIQLGDIGDPESCDGGDYYIRLFNENGEKVHSCGGTNPVDEAFDEVRDVIYDLISKEDRDRIHEESCKITREALGIE